MIRSKDTRCRSAGAVRSDSLAVKAGYCVGNLGKSIVWTSFDVFLLYYLVRIAGFPPLTAGGLLTLLMIADGCADITVAYLADRRGRSDALGHLILLGAPLCGIGFWLIFALPPTGPHAAIIGAAVVCRLGYTLSDIGHNTLLIRIAATTRDATTVSGLRLVFSAIGAGLVGWAATTVLEPSAAGRLDDIATAASLGGAINIATLLIARGATRHLPATAVQTSSAARRPSLAALLHDRSYLNVLGLVAVQASLIPLFNRALPFLGEAARGNVGWAGTAVAVITASQALSLPVWMTLARRWSPRSILASGYGVMLFALGIAAVRSANATGILGLALVGTAQAGMNMAIWALLALTVRHAAVGDVGNEALPVGVFLAAMKGSAGIGNALLVVSISAADQWSAPAPGDVTTPLLLSAITLPALGCAIGVYLVRSLGRL